MICLHCNQEIYNKRNILYCNKDCWNAAKALNPPHGVKKQTMNCTICKKLFTYRSSQRKKPVACSPKCLGEYKITFGNRKGKLLKGGYYKNSDSFRGCVRLLFIQQCAICSWKEANCDVAHIIARKDGGKDTFENVTLLCPNHHRMYDRGLIPINVIEETRHSIILK